MRSLVRSVLVGCAAAGLALAGSASAHAGDGGDGDYVTHVGINKEAWGSGWGSGNDSNFDGKGNAVFGSLVQD
ncbi:hypothetical protein GCM10010365_03630 [Streptomyces poonensis]|uniref:Uncharacterized protein n=1 Tax=Streptomyces poonensis TaxID=68255 RepID=A0A918P7T9_9ACTN|nr:hypothetical protein [Streptomyces poonensis]GGY88828.1 hypothetical protein GCM10010365_03630 [Streptomyces poonensis]GLJ92421.1 hypothetical protein GCM10017589_50300 [Streptomyces poonensis]